MTKFTSRHNFIIYADGACAPTNPGPCSWGCVIFNPDGLKSEHHGFIGYGTNQVSELSAAIEGLSRIPVGECVELFTDSQYVVKGLTEWRSGWEQRNFRNMKGALISNLRFWQQLFELVDARQTSVYWVKGHAGDPNNERADELAVIALKRQSWLV